MRGPQTHEKGQKREFFKWICIHFTLTPLIDYRENKTEYTPHTERGDYSMSLCRWKEIKSLAEEHNQEWFNRLTDTDLYGLEIRKENLADFRKPIKELERIMMNELRDFLLMDRDFQGNQWSDEPLTDREQKYLERLEKTQKMLGKKDFPDYIQKLSDAGLIVRINGKNFFRLDDTKTKNFPKGSWAEQAKKVLKVEKLSIRKWARDNYIRKENGEQYSCGGLTNSIKDK